MSIKPIPVTEADPYGDQLICDCRNRSDLDGFYASDADGTPLHDGGGNPDDNWDGVHYRCARCGQVWGYEHLQMRGHTPAHNNQKENKS